MKLARVLWAACRRAWNGPASLMPGWLDLIGQAWCPRRCRGVELEIELVSSRRLSLFKRTAAGTAFQPRFRGLCLTGILLAWVVMPSTVQCDEGSAAKSADAEKKSSEPEPHPRVVFREERPIEQWRYRTRLQISFMPHARMSIHRQSMLRAQVLRVIDRSWGLLLEGDVDPDDVNDMDTDIDVEINPDHLVPASRRSLERLDAASLHATYDEKNLDKVIMVTVTPHDGGTRVAAREYDTRLRSLSQIHEASTTDERLTAERMFEVIAGAFRPILVVNSVESLSVELRVQGGLFPAPDPNWEQVQKGDILLAVLRYKDRKKVVQKIQQLPSTFVVVEERNSRWVKGTLASALPVSLATSGRRRVDQFCVRVNPVFPSSQVSVVLRRNPKTQLVGHRIRVYPKTRTRDKPDKPPLELLTDRSGAVQIPQFPGNSLVWLYIESGEQLVQRVPFAPGIFEHVKLELLDDSIRLAVEGELDLLEGKLIDTIARRAVFMAMALKGAESGNQKDIDRALSEMELLPALREFTEKLAEIRVSAESQAQVAKDRIAVSRVNRLCDKLDSVLQRYLAETRMREFRDRLEQKIEEAKSTRATGS